MYGGDRGAFASANVALGGTSQPTVVFVGSALSFSDQIVRVANVEFDGIAFERCDTISELTASATKFGNVIALVLDESLASELPDLLADCENADGDYQMVLGYRDVNIAASVFQSHYADDNRVGVSFLPMNQQFDIWLSIMRLLLCGGKYIPEELLEGMSSDTVANRTAPADTYLSDLTDREREVLALVSEGKPNKTIASELELSEHTIKLHIHHVITKLGARNRTEAAIMFLGRGGGEDPATC